MKKEKKTNFEKNNKMRRTAFAIMIIISIVLLLFLIVMRIAIANTYITGQGAQVEGYNLSSQGLIIGNATTKGNITFPGASSNAIIDYNDTDRIVYLRMNNASYYHYAIGDPGSYKAAFVVNSRSTQNGVGIGAYQAWIRAAKINQSSTEIFGFWGGGYDDDTEQPVNVGASTGVYSYNLFFGTRNRTVTTMIGGIGANEVNDNVSGTDIIGYFAQSISGGAPTYTNSIGLSVNDAAGGSLKNNYGIKVEDIISGITDHAIYTGSGDVRFGGAVNLTNKVVRYNNIFTEGYGVPAIVDHVALTGQSAAISTTSASSTNSAGLYRISYYLETTTLLLTAGTVQLSYTWIDDAGVTTTSSIALALSVLGRTSDIFYVQNNRSSSINYSTTLAGGAIGTARYSLYHTVERLN